MITLVGPIYQIALFYAGSAAIIPPPPNAQVLPLFGPTTTLVGPIYQPVLVESI